MLLLLLTIMF